MSGDGGCSARSRWIFEVTFWMFKLSKTLGDGVSSLSTFVQLLADLSGIEASPSEKLDDWSILDIRHVLEMKAICSSSFSYEEQEPIGEKLFYVNKNVLCIEWCKANVWRMRLGVRVARTFRRWWQLFSLAYWEAIQLRSHNILDFIWMFYCFKLPLNEDWWPRKMADTKDYSSKVKQNLFFQ